MKREQIGSEKFKPAYYIKMRRELVLWKRDLRNSPRMQYREIQKRKR